MTKIRQKAIIKVVAKIKKGKKRKMSFALEFIYHIMTIILLHDYIPVAGGVIPEDSQLLELAYEIAGL